MKKIVLFSLIGLCTLALLGFSPSSKDNSLEPISIIGIGSSDIFEKSLNESLDQTLLGSSSGSSSSGSSSSSSGSGSGSSDDGGGNHLSNKTVKKVLKATSKQLNIGYPQLKQQYSIGRCLINCTNPPNQFEVILIPAGGGQTIGVIIDIG